MGMTCLYFPMSVASDGALEGWICDLLKAHPLTSQELMLVDEKDFCVIFTWTTLQFLRAWWMDFKGKC